MNTASNPRTHDPRKALRKRSYLRGAINFNKACNTFDCVVRDISPEGARLDLSGAVSLPDIFDLYIPQKERTLCANIAWRNGEEVGVAFVQPSAVARPAVIGGLAQRVIQLEAELGSLKRSCMALRSSRTPKQKI